MVVVRRYNPGNLHFPNRIMEKLDTIYSNPITIVEAASGFGKTTSVRHLLEDCKDPVIWFNIDSDDKDRFFSDFCARIKSFDEEGSNKLLAIGYPLDEDDCVKLANVLIDLKINENTILVLDNYHLISDDKITKILLDVAFNDSNNLRVVLLTQVIKTELVFEMVYKNKINYINQSVLSFSYEDIIDYCRNCGVRLNNEEADFLYKYTEGWISAVYLQLVNYIDTGVFDINATIDSLITNAIWKKLNHIEQDFFTNLGIYENFSFRQAVSIAEGKLSENKISDILKTTSLIRYDSKERRYYMHSFLKYYLTNEFQKLEKVFKNQVYIKAGKWYGENEQYIEAIKYFYLAKDYENIYALEHDADVIVRNATTENKEMFMNILLRTPYEIKQKYPRMAVVYLYVMFIYRERDYLQVESRVIMEMIDNSTLSERQKNILRGEIYFCLGMCEYNDIRKMKELFIKAYDYLKSPSTAVGVCTGWTLGSPSVLYSYHRDSGMALDELEILESSLPYLFKLAHGHGKGGDAVMKAEILFMRGEIDGAEVLCQKAIYMAETRKQTSIYLAAMFLLARIAIFRGEHDTLADTLSIMQDKVVNVKDRLISVVTDLAIGFTGVLLENDSMIPGWLENDITIEEKCGILNLGFANIIYGRYLIMTEKYRKLLGISGQFLGVAGVYNNVMYKIYTYIYISIANYRMNNIKKAKNFMNEALMLAMPDGFYIPFVENYKHISTILDEIDSDYPYFIKMIKDNEKLQYNMLKVAKLSLKNNQNYGLTSREYTVAKLAAKRLTNKEIAEKLFIAESTVKSNMKTIFSKLGISSRSDLTKFF
ncbi:MAG: hypothetical protein E7270_07415 [Lachnospiraceae bacterium]|nr:hypothetical protein [Lachnospiraceae bacterium]